jgi:hypothetical protein
VTRSFTSEDFLILRRLTEAPFWETALTQFQGPWLGTTVVLFYRPVASFLLLLQIAALGLNPALLTLLQIGLHGLCVVLVFRIAGRLFQGAAGSGGRVEGMVVALLFALYPLHANTVVWIASFVNLYAAVFLLASVWWYQRDRPGWALGAFALALGCYEAAVVLPFLLVAIDLTAGTARATSWKVRARRWGPFFLVLGAYFAVRLATLGTLVGGYAGTRSRLLEEPLTVLLAALAAPVRLLLPLEPALAVGWAAAGFLALAALAVWRGDRIALLGLGWTLLAQAPFGFVALVPGNGRFGYLAAFGMALAVVSLVPSLVPRQSPAQVRRSALWIAGSGVAVLWAALLWPVLGHYREAGRLGRKIPEAIQRALDGTTSPRGPVFLTRYPTFVHTAGGAPAAQLFTWGLRDAVNPPFSDPGVNLYPLPPLGDGALRAVVEGQPEALVLLWDGESETVHPFRVTPGLTTATAGVEIYHALEPAPGAVAASTTEILLPRGAPAPTTLLLAGPSNPHREPVTATPDGEGRLRIPFPAAFLEAQAELYHGTVYWWLETRGPAGELLAFTPARELRVTEE